MLPNFALTENHTFSFRLVARSPRPLPSPCFRFTGSGDRPCNTPQTPMNYAVTPWTYPVSMQSMLFYWSWSKIDASNPLVYTDLHLHPMAFTDHSWVEVVRYAERTTYVGSDGGGYGVWYWLLPGGGVSVNIGRSLRFNDKRKAIRWANTHHPQNTTLKCMEFEHDSCDTHTDALFCAAARFHAYNSIIVRRDWVKYSHVSGSQSDVIELILCPTTEPAEQVLACPPSIEHRLADGQTRCTCNATGELLACKENGHTGSFKLAEDYGTRPVAIIGASFAVFIGIPLLIGAGIVAARRSFRNWSTDSSRVGVAPRSGSVERPLLATMPSVPKR